MQVQRWLGHHSASFTLDTYVHFMDDDLGEPLSREAELGPDKVAMLEPTEGETANNSYESRPAHIHVGDKIG